MPAAPSRRLPTTVIVLGLVSFFNDLASEMVTPLLPIFLASGLGAGALALGTIEGVADAVASFLKLGSGRLSDLLGGRRKGLTVAGYLVSNMVRPLIGLAQHWTQILGLRAIDRLGKGVRNAPRDALIADVTPPEMTGQAFGLHRALDNGGALAGALAAAAILHWTPLPIPHVILLSAIPGSLAVLLLFFGVRERTPSAPRSTQAHLPPLRWSNLSISMQRYLLIVAVFTLSRVSETFIVLRGHELQMGTVELLLLWAALNGVKALVGTPGGKLADRIGRARFLSLGWMAFGISFAFIGQVTGPTGLWISVLLFGFFVGATEGAERALVNEFASEQERGTAYGWYHLISGLTAVIAGVGFGAIWDLWKAATAFTLAGMLALIAGLLLHRYLRHTGV